VLTDILGKKTYASCLTFPEKVPFKAIRKHFEPDPAQPGSQKMDETSRLKDTDILYAPKTLMVLSYTSYYTVFRSCLCALYDIYLRGSPVSFNR